MRHICWIPELTQLKDFKISKISKILLNILVPVTKLHRNRDVVEFEPIGAVFT